MAYNTVLYSESNSIATITLKDRGAEVPLKKPLDSVVQMSADIAKKQTVAM